MRIVFMGTPAFAVPSLDILLNAGHNIVGVITSTDKLGGRGKKQLLESEVKMYAARHKLNILQPRNLKAASFRDELKSLNADLQVVVAFRMLPEVVWNMPPLGTINLHGSLLPKYRGAAPINWAIINGESKSGVTAFKLKHEIDTGDILFSEPLEILANDTAGSFHDRMMYLGAKTIARAVAAIDSGNIKSIPQLDSESCPAPKIYNEHCEIDFNQNSLNVYNFIRGLSPFPTAWMRLPDGSVLKVYWSEYEIENSDLVAGSVESDNRSYLKISTEDGFVSLKEIQLSGKRRMNIKDFLNGYKF